MTNDNANKQNNGQTEKSPVENIRDRIRSKTVGSSGIFKSRIIKYDGIDIEIREPTVEGWGKILASSRKRTVRLGELEETDEALNFAEYLVWSVIYCSYVPGTNIQVYDKEDYDVLIKKPKSGFIGEFSDIAGELMKVDTEKATKNLETIAGDN